MKKTNKKDSLNLVFSAFLILGYIICSYFFLTFGATTDLAPYLNLVVFTVFGLIVFYATRVGDGKAVKRFSPWTLIILDIPALYAILAYFIPALPLHTAIANLGGQTPLDYSPILILACVALGYGIPYTFLSGFETDFEEEAEETAEETVEETAEDTESTPCQCDCSECAGCDTAEKEETADAKDTAEEAAEVSEETEKEETSEE